MIYLVSNRLFDTDTYKLATCEDVLEYFKDKFEIETDSETKLDFLDGYMFTLQLGDYENQFVIDGTCNDLLQFKDLLENKLLILQNAKYDLKFLLKLGIKPKLVYDCFLAECILTTGAEGRKLGLDALVEKYTDGKLDKSVRGVINYEGLSERVVLYSAFDVKYLGKIREKQVEQLEKLELTTLMWLENMANFVFTEMEYYGMKLNVPKWLANAEKNKKFVVEYEDKLTKYILDNPQKFGKFIDRQLSLFDEGISTNVNWNSPKQLLDIFAAEGVKVESVNEKVIQSIDNPLVKLYLDYKEYQTKISKFGKDFLRWVYKKDNRVRTSYWTILNTGRVSSGRKDEFPNMQQLPADNDFRNCFEAEEGWLFTDCDYSAMEIALSADASGEPSWIEGYKNGWDLHSVVAETVFKDKWLKAEEEGCEFRKNKSKCNCKEHKYMRNNIKTLNYLAIYGGGPNKLAQSVNIPLEEAKTIISSYFKGLPKLSAMLKFLKNYGRTNLHIRTKKPFYRIRYFADPKGDSGLTATIERQSGNTFVQGSGADITKYAMYLLYEYRNRHNLPVKFVLQLHDAIVCEVKEEYAEEWLRIQRRIMRLASRKTLKHLTIDVDGYVSKVWKK